MSTETERLEELRAVLRAECISYGELAELAGLVAAIEPGDLELLEAAGWPEFAVDLRPGDKLKDSEDPDAVWVVAEWGLLALEGGAVDWDWHALEANGGLGTLVRA